MPFKSDAQRRWMFKNKPEMAKKWAEHTPDMENLPDRIRRTRREQRAMKRRARRRRS